MEIKAAEEILEKCFKESAESNLKSKNLVTGHRREYFKEAALKAMKEYAIQFIDYASENVEVDYNKLTPVFYKGNMVDDGVEVFIPKGEFNKIKKLIK